MTIRVPTPNESTALDGRITTVMHAWMRLLTAALETANAAHTALVGSLPAIMARGTAAPATGAHVVGEIVWNTVPTSGGNIGWVCTTAGTPGTWKAWGTIA
jgi:hypothetical protein